jgi:hypothetical protein
MTKLLLVSKEWAPKNKTGLGFCSSLHESVFNEVGFETKTVGMNDTSREFNLGLKSFFHFLLHPFFFLKKAENIIKSYKPDVIAVESLQTVVSEIFLYLSKKNKIRSIIISHGISLLPYKINFKYFFRAILWIIYLPLFYWLIRISNFFLSLDLESQDNRHIDTQLSKRVKNKVIIKYNNCSRFEICNNKIITNNPNQKVILCIGYINHIKNQEALVKLAEEIYDLDIKIRILYNDFDENYLNKLKKKIKLKKIFNIDLVHENSTEIFSEIKKCWILINVSITEVSPLSLIEGNSLSKFFLSYDVGSLKEFKGGIINSDMNQIVFNIRSLYANIFWIKKLEDLALNDYLRNYSKSNLTESFQKIRNCFL